MVFGWNIDSDHGSIGGGRAVLAYRAGRPFEPTFMFHEVGHILGREHSRSVDDGVCGDRFDIMSAMSVWTYQDAWQRKACPAATALNLQRLRWLDDDRIHRFNAVEDGGEFGDPVEGTTVNREDSLFLTPLYRPDATLAEARAAEIRTPAGIFHLEYREPTGWDAGLPGRRVLVHRDEGVPVLLGGGWQPTGALAEGTDLKISDDPYPWGFIFHGVRADGCAEVALWADYL